MVMAADEASLTLWESTFETAVVEPAPQLRSPIDNGAPRSAPSRRRIAPPLPWPVDDPRSMPGALAR
jgi:hypothetical protein